MDLLLAHRDDGSPVLDRGADPSTAAAVVRAVPPREERFLADITANANDLVRQGWAVVSAEGPGSARLEALVKDLVRARAEEQQAEVLSIRVPPNMNVAAAREWKRTVYPTLYDDESRRPRYLLILGDPDQVSLDTEQVLTSDSMTGRLACKTDDGYSAYVNKVLTWQRTPSQHDRARALFYTVHDGTAATTAGHAKLIQPCHDRCARTARDKPCAFPASSVEAHGAATPDRDELQRLAAIQHPSVLLSLSHGLGPPRRRPWTPLEACEHQGAMSFGTEGVLGAQDLGSTPFLPGGVWIYFACFGAGTPRTSAYHHWLEMLAAQGTELGPLTEALRGLDPGGGFVSGVGKAALANPDGPLAILGHIDLAWSYSYEELRVDRSGEVRRVTGSNRSLNFFQLMTKLVAGERAGAAALALKLQLGEVGAELTSYYDRCKRDRVIEGATPADLLALGNLWMLHQDLLGYTLLGDPAVQLPLADLKDDHRRRDPTMQLPLADLKDDDRGRGRGVDAALDQLERAALAVAGGDNPGAIAVELGVPRSDVAEAVEVYRKAGRAALSALLQRRDKDDGADR